MTVLVVNRETFSMLSLKKNQQTNKKQPPSAQSQGKVEESEPVTWHRSNVKRSQLKQQAFSSPLSPNQDVLVCKHVRAHTACFLQ